MSDFLKDTQSISVSGVFDADSDALFDSILGKTHKTITCYPQGNKWFLPKYELVVEDLKVDCCGKKYEMDGTIVSSTNLTDNRRQAKLMRWFWIHSKIIQWIFK